jgi:hypothetical protein
MIRSIKANCAAIDLINKIPKKKKKKNRSVATLPPENVLSIIHK